MRVPRSRHVAAALFATVAMLAGCGQSAPRGDGAVPPGQLVSSKAPAPTRTQVSSTQVPSTAAPSTEVTTDETRPAPSESEPTVENPLPARSDLPSTDSAERRFVEAGRLTGDMTPKSVVASGQGLVVAQNMIYTHTVSAFSSDGLLLSTIDDAIVPSEFGHPEWTEQVEGGPVEAAFTPDGSELWVSNYSMYGPGFDSPGDDVCSPESGIDPSFVYRIDTSALQIKEVVKVGAVPKYLEVTPDAAHVLVTNWCTWDLSIIGTGSGADGAAAEVARVPMGRYPRGIAISADSSTAYVAVMGSSDIAVVDIPAAVDGAGEDAVTWFRGIGRSPRHLNLSPDGRFLFATLNKDGEVAKISTDTGSVVGTVQTGQQPRSAALSADGTALFVVNYESDTVSRIRTSDLEVLETVPVDHHPIGITYDALTERIWVASYGGALTVFDDGSQG